MALTRAYFYSFALFSLCLCLDLAQAASGDFFTHPPPEDTTNSLSDNQVYKVGDLLQIEWETSMKDFALLLWQDGPSLDNNGGLFRTSPVHYLNLLFIYNAQETTLDSLPTIGR